ncbi:effector-associated domain 2-containing protein [Actinomadura sp. HBU206391]|uniref:VMAP-C domain-containing protein n=1 Tax=Actinomadura sp. HBU206391 TaxID=2731692 RepID=UPI00164F99E1|nr:hypothetical protein [Actinomadura sp. HBU206391]MBC6459876.1 hypothetical protein [Actinomadura sp. HBU206391]
MGDDMEGWPALTGRPLEPGMGPVATGPEQSGQVTLEIADALVQIRDFQDEAGRSALVHAVSEALGAPLLLSGHGSPKVLLYNLVATCREFPEGMPALVRAVDFLAGHTSAAATIRRLASPASDLLHSAVETQIKDLLEGLTLPSLARVYYTATGGGSPAPRRLTDAWDAFSILLDANAGPDGLPPHLVFIELLIQMMRRRQSADMSTPQERWRSERLRKWMTAQLEELRGSGGSSAASRLDRIRDRPELLEVRPDLPIYLIIQLERLPTGGEAEDMYRLSHWRQVHPLEWRPEPGDDRAVALHEVPQQVAELVQEAEGGWAYDLDDSLVIEVVLPLELLNLDLDQWTRDPPGVPHPTPLGSEYEVLVRSHERLRTLHMHRAWRQRWRTLLGAEGATHWAAGEPPPDPQLLHNRLLAEKNVVACVLSSPPDREPGRSELWMALRAGVPVVLWDRTDGAAAEFETELREVIEGPDLRRLPDDVKRLRVNAMGDAKHIDRRTPQVTLLWDDPTHFLDDAPPLRSPQAS